MQFEGFCNKILQLDPSIRFAGLEDHVGTVLAISFRKNLKPKPTDEEIIEYGRRAIIRTGAVESGGSIGRLQYLIGKYEKLLRATVPIILKDKFYLILSLDLDSDAAQVIEHKILPYIEENKF
jgi:hypothetical protein